MYSKMLYSRHVGGADALSPNCLTNGWVINQACSAPIHPSFEVHKKSSQSHSHPIRALSKVARWQNWIPSCPWIAPGWRAWGHNPRKGRDQILLRSVAHSQSFKPDGQNGYNHRIWPQPSGNHGFLPSNQPAMPLASGRGFISALPGDCIFIVLHFLNGILSRFSPQKHKRRRAKMVRFPARCPLDTWFKVRKVLDSEMTRVETQ